MRLFPDTDGREEPVLFFLDQHSGVPFYRQLMEQVRLHVATGALNAGDELPSIRALAVTLGVNPMTVSKAYGYLENEGVLDRRPGRPLIVSTFSGEQLAIGRRERLREALRDPAALARRLGVSERDALSVFRELLTSVHERGRDGEESR